MGQSVGICQNILKIDNPIFISLWTIFGYYKNPFICFHNMVIKAHHLVGGGWISVVNHDHATCVFEKVLHNFALCIYSFPCSNEDCLNSCWCNRLSWWKVGFQEFWLLLRRAKFLSRFKFIIRLEFRHFFFFSRRLIRVKLFN